MFLCCRESFRCQVFLDRKMRRIAQFSGPPYIMIAMRLEHAGHYSFFCIVRTPGCVKCRRCCLVEAECRAISASSSTRRGRMDTMRHLKSRCANSRFSSSMPSVAHGYMFHPKSSGDHSKHSEYSQESCGAGCPPGRQPNETYKVILAPISMRRGTRYEKTYMQSDFSR